MATLNNIIQTHSTHFKHTVFQVHMNLAAKLQEKLLPSRKTKTKNGKYIQHQQLIPQRGKMRNSLGRDKWECGATLGTNEWRHKWPKQVAVRVSSLRGVREALTSSYLLTSCQIMPDALLLVLLRQHLAALRVQEIIKQNKRLLSNNNNNNNNNKKVNEINKWKHKRLNASTKWEVRGEENSASANTK